MATLLSTAAPTSAYTASVCSAYTIGSTRHKRRRLSASAERPIRPSSPHFKLEEATLASSVDREQQQTTEAVQRTFGRVSGAGADSPDQGAEASTDLPSGTVASQLASKFASTRNERIAAINNRYGLASATSDALGTPFWANPSVQGYDFLRRFTPWLSKLTQRYTVLRRARPTGQDHEDICQQVLASIRIYLSLREPDINAHRLALSAFSYILLLDCVDAPPEFDRLIGSVASSPDEWPLYHSQSAPVILDAWLLLVRNLDERLKAVEYRVLRRFRTTLGGLLRASDATYRILNVNEDIRAVATEVEELLWRREKCEEQARQYALACISLSPSLLRPAAARTLQGILLLADAGDTTAIETWRKLQELPAEPLVYLLARAHLAGGNRDRAAATEALEDLLRWQQERGSGSMPSEMHFDAMGQLTYTEFVETFSTAFARALAVLVGEAKADDKDDASASSLYVAAAAAICPLAVYRPILVAFCNLHIANGSNQSIDILRLIHEYLDLRRKGTVSAIAEDLRLISEIAPNLTRHADGPIGNFNLAATLYLDGLAYAREYGEHRSQVEEDVADFVHDCLTAASDPSTRSLDEGLLLLDLAYAAYVDGLQDNLQMAPMRLATLVGNLAFCLARYGRPHLALKVAIHWCVRAKEAATTEAEAERVARSTNDILRDAFGLRLVQSGRRKWNPTRSRRLAIALSVFLHCDVVPRAFWSSHARKALVEWRRRRTASRPLSDVDAAEDVGVSEDAEMAAVTLKGEPLRKSTAYIPEEQDITQHDIDTLHEYLRRFPPALSTHVSDFDADDRYRRIREDDEADDEPLENLSILPWTSRSSSRQ